MPGNDANTELLLHANGQNLARTAYAHYKAEESSGSTLVDDGLGANNGTITGAAYNDGQGSGVFNQAIWLDGTSGYVAYTDSADFTFGTGDWTIDFWVKFNALSATQPIISQNEDATNYWTMWKYNSTDTRLRIYYVESNIARFDYHINWDDCVADRWYHVAWVRNGSNVYVFIDGVSQDVTQNTAAGDLADISANLYLGNASNPVGYLDGALDEFRISKGLARWTSDFTPQTTAYASDVNTQLLCHFDNSLADSGNTGHGIAGSGSGRGYGGQSFNGSQYDTVDALVTDIRNDTYGTISLWAYISSAGSGGTLFGIGATPGSTTYQTLRFYASTNGFYAYLEDSTGSNPWQIRGTLDKSTDTWYHVAIVHNGVEPKIYVNGVDETVYINPATASGKAQWLDAINGADTLNTGRIGCLNNRDLGNRLFFTGFISDFRYYQAPLSQTEISFLYNSGTGTRRDVVYDSAIGASSASVGYSQRPAITYNGASLQDSAVVGTESLGGHAQFTDFKSGDSTNRWFLVADSADWDFGTGDFTVEFWFNSEYRYTTPFIGAQDTAGVQTGWSIYAANSRQISFNMSTNNVTDFTYTSSASELAGRDEWTHIAFVRNGNTLQGYINGVPFAASQDVTGVSIDSGGVGLSMGRFYPDSDTSYTRGRADEVRISKGTARYTADFSSSLPGRHTSDANTDLLLHFDTDVTTDSGPNNHTITNTSVLHNPGSKWSTAAIKFDGTDDYVSMPDPADEIEPLATAQDNWTIDCQIYEPTRDASGNNTIWAKSDGGTTYFRLGQNGNAGSTGNHIRFQTYDGTQTFNCDSEGLATVANDGWHHISMCKVGRFFGIYYDGVQISYIWQNFLNPINQPFQAGALASTDYWNGNIDELRVQKDNYFLAAPNSYPQCPLLTYADSVTSSYQVFDGASYIHAGTGGGDWDWDAAFTAEVWFNSGDMSVSKTLLSQWTDGTNYFILRLSSTGSAAGTYVWWYTVSGGVVVHNVATPTGILEEDTWYHIAVTRSSSGTFNIYVNGVLQVGPTTQANPVADFTGNLDIGRRANATEYFIGNIAQVRISNIERYTAEFTPSRYFLENDSNVVLNSKFDGFLTDSSDSGHTLTNSGTTFRFQNEGFATDPFYGASSSQLDVLEFCHMPMEDNTDRGTGANAVSDIGTPTYTAGKIGNALTLNGIDQALNLNAFASDVASDTAGTISLWFTVDDVSTVRTIFALSDDTGTADWFRIAITTSGQLQVYSNLSAAQWRYQSTLGITVGGGTWHHLAVVQDGVYPKIYLNGTDVTNLVDETDVTAWFSTASINNARLGVLTLSSGNSSWHDGQIDDFRYYQNQALAPFQIAKIYNEGNGMEHQLHAHGFDGSSSFLTVADDNGFRWDLANSATDQWTVDAWICSQGLSGAAGRIIVSQNDGTGSNRWDFGVSSGANPYHLYCNVVNGGVQHVNLTSTIESIADYKWHHVALVKQGQHYGLYTDGVQTAYALSTGTVAVTGDLEVGRSNSAGGIYYWNGYMEQVQITEANKFGVCPCPQPDNHFYMDDSAANTTVSDDGVEGDDGVASVNTNTSGFSVAGKIGNALDFDGTTSSRYVQTDNWASFVNGDTSGSLCFWVNKNSLTDSTIMSWVNDGANTQVTCAINDSGTVFYWFQTLTGSLGNYNTFTPAQGNFSTGTWYHLAFVQDTTGFMKGYCNGVEATRGGTSPGSRWFAYSTGLNRGDIGCAGRHNGGSRTGFSDNIIDDIRYYSGVVLSEAQIWSIYQGANVNG